MTTSTILAFSALGLHTAAGIEWMRLIYAVRVGEGRHRVFLMVGGAMLAGIVALALGAGPAATAAAWFSVVLSLLFGALMLQSQQSQRVVAARVGAPMVPFTAPDQDGRAFDLASMAGRPYLLKFFRGHWCPFCVAELRRWEEMRPELDRRGIELVGICMDTPEKIRAGRHKHGARITLLADPDLVVTTRYNLVNHRGLSPRGLRRLPIPTTILVDAGGTVRWIDQATDYAVRSDPDRVLSAIAEMGSGTFSRPTTPPRAAGTSGSRTRGSTS